MVYLTSSALLIVFVLMNIQNLCAIILDFSDILLIMIYEQFLILFQ
jgi:hypothetical protein